MKIRFAGGVSPTWMGLSSAGVGGEFESHAAVSAGDRAFIPARR